MAGLTDRLGTSRLPRALTQRRLRITHWNSAASLSEQGLQGAPLRGPFAAAGYA